MYNEEITGLDSKLEY